MTLQEFINTAPEQGQLSMLKNELDEVIAITVNRIDCSLSAYDSSLNQLTGLTIQVGEDVLVTVENVNKYGGYYYLKVVPFEFTETVNEDLCVSVLLEPFDENTSLEFRNTEFYPLFNNVPENLTQATFNNIFKGKVEVRRGKNIYDVDRKNDAIIPTNITNILEDTANLAEFPESNYSSLSNITGRYIGSKTSVVDYGVPSLINGTAFEAAEYPTSIASGSICNISSTDRKIQSYIFTQPTGKNQQTNSTTPSVTLDHLYWIDLNPPIFSKYQTSITVQRRLDIAVGDVLIVEDQDRRINEDNIGLYEYLKVTKVTLTSSTTSLEFIRNYLTDYDPNSGEFTSGQAGQFGFTKVIGSTIYNTNSSKLFKVVGKKIWIQETEDILIVDKTGFTVIKEKNCSL